MNRLSVRKIQHVPFSLHEDDPILMDNFSREQLPDILAELGYKDAKKKIVDGVQVYYKSRRNGVYVSYR